MVIILSALVFFVFLSGCSSEELKSEELKDESGNLAAVRSPDGSRVAFVRHFTYVRYHYDYGFPDTVTKDDVYEATFIYIIDLTTKKLKKLIEPSYTRTNLSWEGDLIAYYEYGNTIKTIKPDGSMQSPFCCLESHYGVWPFTLSGDSKILFYVDNDYGGLKSVDLNGNKFSGEKLNDPDCRDIEDMIWDSTQDRILLIKNVFLEPKVWQIKPDGTELKLWPQGLAEYRRRRLGGLDFPELRALIGISNFTYADWGVPALEEFE